MIRANFMNVKKIFSTTVSVTINLLARRPSVGDASGVSKRFKDATWANGWTCLQQRNHYKTSHRRKHLYRASLTEPKNKKYHKSPAAIARPSPVPPPPRTPPGPPAPRQPPLPQSASLRSQYVKAAARSCEKLTWRGGADAVSSSTSCCLRCSTVSGNSHC